MAIDGYYYLHTNGDLIYKKAVVVDHDPNYFDSPFVRKVWPIDLKSRAKLYSFLIEAAAMEARSNRIKEIRELNSMTDEDCQTFAERTGFKLFKDGNQWCAAKGDFVNLQESIAGFGDTPFEAFVALCRKVKAEVRQ